MSTFLLIVLSYFNWLSVLNLLKTAFLNDVSYALVSRISHHFNPNKVLNFWTLFLFISTYIPAFSILKENLNIFLKLVAKGNQQHHICH